MAHDHPEPDADRMLTAKLTGIARRHARWGDLDDDQAAAAVAELREVADGRADLLAEVAGISLGASEARGPGYEALGQAVAELCRAAGADEEAIPAWTEEGRRRAEARRFPPISQPATLAEPAAGRDLHPLPFAHVARLRDRSEVDSSDASVAPADPHRYVGGL